MLVEHVPLRHTYSIDSRFSFSWEILDIVFTLIIRTPYYLPYISPNLTTCEPLQLEEEWQIVVTQIRRRVLWRLIWGAGPGFTLFT